jgi:hypothetical protein
MQHTPLRFRSLLRDYTGNLALVTLSNFWSRCSCLTLAGDRQLPICFAIDISQARSWYRLLTRKPVLAILTQRRLAKNAYRKTRVIPSV